LAGTRKGEVDPEALDMADVVAQALQRLELMIEKYEARVVKPKSWPVAVGYPPWIEAIWTNYISNALKYGGRPPRIELGADSRSNGTIRFWVRDNGKGLTPEEQASLFAEFTRLDETRAEGHGLGLSIVRRIIEKSGGQVGVESEVGQGSLFYFTLPQATDPT
jgi:signal transduction histidine kinase